MAKSNLAIALNNKGLALSKTPQEAIQYFEQASFVDPDNKTTEANLGGVIRLMSLNPQNFDDRVGLAESALKRNELAAALVEYKAALAIKEDTGIRQKMDSFPKPGDYAYLFFDPKSNWEESAIANHLDSGRKCLEAKQFRSAILELQFVLSVRSNNKQANALLDKAKDAFAQDQAVSERSTEDTTKKTDKN